MNYIGKRRLLRNVFASSFSEHLSQKLIDYGIHTADIESFVVLDVNCGNGCSTLALAENLPNCSKIIGIDASESLINDAQKKLKARNIAPDRVEFYQTPNLDLSSESILDQIYLEIGLIPGTIYMITFQHTFPHQNHESALKIFQKLLSPGGFIVILDHLWSSIDAIYHEFAYGCAANLPDFLPTGSKEKPSDESVTESWCRRVENIPEMSLCTIAIIGTNVRLRKLRDVIKWSENLCPILERLPEAETVPAIGRFVEAVIDEHFIPTTCFSLDIDATLVLMQSTLGGEAEEEELEPEPEMKEDIPVQVIVLEGVSHEQ